MDKIEIQIKKLVIKFIALSIVFLVLLLITTLSLEYNLKRNLALSMGQSIRNQILMQNFRDSAVSIATLKNQFESIFFLNEKKYLQQKFIDSSQSNYGLIQIKFPIYSDIENQYLFGTVVFKYSPLTTIILSIGIWVFLLLASVPFFYRSKAKIQESYLLTLEIEKKKFRIELATQLVHDIRSPISALNLVASTIKNLSNEQKNLIQNSILRINEISNTMLRDHKVLSISDDLSVNSTNPSKEISSKISPQVMPIDFNVNNNEKIDSYLDQIIVPVDELIDLIVKEKLVQLKNQEFIKLNVEIDKSKKFYTKLNPVEFKRALSNLLNNSVEAIDKHGEVTIALRDYDNDLTILIKDNGKGIPDEVLKNIGKRGFSYGKVESDNSGSGLGVYQAKKAIESSNGKILFQSRQGVGTLITITLPKTESLH